MPIESNPYLELIEAIHATSSMLVLEFAGAGAQALAWLHQVGGSSNTVLEATDRYAQASMQTLLGLAPETYTSAETAQAMAQKAFRRAVQLGPAARPVIGLGCTAAIATKRQKRGGHQAYVATYTTTEVTMYHLTLVKGQRTRIVEEALVSALILQALAEACGLSFSPPLDLETDEALQITVIKGPPLERLIRDEVAWVLVGQDGQMTTGTNLSNITLLSGSFNPLHQGHQQLRAIAAEHLQQTVYFELPLVNADKAPIDLVETQKRLIQFQGVAPILLTCAPLFSLKATLFPESVFVLGIDTAIRLIDPRFYQNNPAQMETALDIIRANGCRFLVAGRLQGDKFLTLSNITLPSAYQDLFIEIPETQFRRDISSTELREQRA